MRRMRHGGPQCNTWVPGALDALDRWVDYHQSGSASGSPPPDVLGDHPRD